VLPFSPSTRHTLQLANYEAKRLKSPHVAPEHLLLAIINARPPIARPILIDAGITLAPARLQVERFTRQWAVIQVKDVLPRSAETDACITLARDEAEQMRHKQVLPEHLLLAILVDQPGQTSHVLQHLGAPIDEMAQELSDKLRKTRVDADPQPALPCNEDDLSYATPKFQEDGPWTALLRRLHLLARK
jgi:ATP-dependent Clp protease ATP-binding subunit ClpC